MPDHLVEFAELKEQIPSLSEQNDKVVVELWRDWIEARIIDFYGLPYNSGANQTYTVDGLNRIVVPIPRKSTSIVSISGLNADDYVLLASKRQFTLKSGLPLRQTYTIVVVPENDDAKRKMAVYAVVQRLSEGGPGVKKRETQESALTLGSPVDMNEILKIIHPIMGG